MSQPVQFAIHLCFISATFNYLLTSLCLTCFVSALNIGFQDAHHGREKEPQIHCKLKPHGGHGTLDKNISQRQLFNKS
jgi:hypothetical protein